MKRSLFAVVFCVLFIAIVAATPASAQKSALVGVIDTQAFMRDSIKVQEKRQVFLMALEEKQGQLRAKQEAVRKIETDLRESGATLSPADRRTKTDLLEREAKEFQRLREDLAEETRKQDAEISRQILGELSALLQDYQARNKYTLILERRFVAAFDDAVDITADIIKAYDAKK